MAQLLNILVMLAFGQKNGLRGLYSLGAADLVVNATPRFMI
jgi:hypothetical protein